MKWNYGKIIVFSISSYLWGIICWKVLHPLITSSFLFELSVKMINNNGFE
jgi:hypothetical protein